jgi:hypothetical protein
MQMKGIITLISILIFAASSFAAEISKKEIISFLDKWLAAQNTGSYSSYSVMYSERFTGIRQSGSHIYKLNHDVWLEDRKRMFKKKMTVKANNPEIMLSNTTASIKFEQILKSGTYRDNGDKILDLIIENGKLKIIREELLASQTASNPRIKQEKYISKYTSIKDKDCIKIKSHNMILLLGSDSVLECPAPNGWRLFKEYDQEEIRSWIRLSYKDTFWTTINQVWGEEKYEFGHFPNVDSQSVEWRISKSGEPNALIFRVNAQNPKKSSDILTRFFVISLTNNVPRFCGMFKTNEEARKIAEESTPCTTMLERRTLLKRQ